jgi:hypothetical protein
MSSGPDVPPGKIVPVHVGFVLGVAAAGCVVAAAIGLLAGMAWWALVSLTVAALAASGAAAALGIFGVIRHGIFTEGFGMGQVRSDLRRAAWARLSATTGGAALIGSLVVGLLTLLKFAF